MLVSSWILALLLAAVGTASTVATPMAYDSVSGHATTPDSAFWGLERAGESLKLIFTPSPAEKAKFHLALADERIAEAEASNDPETIRTGVNEYMGELAQALVITEGLNSTELYELVSNATWIHIVQLEALYLKLSLLEGEVSDEAKATIEEAIDASEKGNAEALKHIKGKP